MLWTTPESLHEVLPFTDKSRDLTITADARIDNRDELMGQLNLAAQTHGQLSDSQLILAAYGKWGEDCPQHLIGDFAFLIWDNRSRKLFCARDHIGAKPFFYYHREGRKFCVASEIKALFCLPEVPRKLNERRIGDHLQANFSDKIHTFYEDVLRLPPAHSLTVTKSSTRLHNYWVPDLSRELRLKSSGEYVEAFREVFTEAVRCRLRSAYAIGSTLSGGLDSSSIACVARDVAAPQKVHTFSAIYPSLAEIDRRIDERSYIEAALSGGEFEAHYIHADAISPLHNIEKIEWHEDGPLTHPSQYLMWAVGEVAQANGVRVVCTGDDGDSTVSHGWNDLPELAIRGSWKTLAREVKAIAEQTNGKVSPMGVIRKSVIKPFIPLIPQNAAKWARKLQRNSIATESNLSLSEAGVPIKVEFFERLCAAHGNIVANVNNSMVRYTRNADKKMHWESVNSGLFTSALDVMDKAATASSMETRYPFFDRRLIEFCIAVPPGEKLHQGWTRSLLRRSMEGILPPQIQWRKDKGNLSANWKNGLLKERAIWTRLFWKAIPWWENMSI
jgi:asparagine synthase (glutamine-hydrolysing)